ncbi:HNH endonuclease [Desulfobacula sp.]|uniref:HNH endonuclease n=1 Tax=Desulfobacula sp. TaxID=2593537 RepID=UPI0039B85D11
MDPKIISETIQEFDGNRYYLCRKHFQRRGVLLHREVWKWNNGEIPKGYVVHHKDHDSSNNNLENLRLLRRGIHNAYHAKNSDHANWIKAMHKGAKKWHGSENGKDWHKLHYERDCKEKMHKKFKKVCEFCGTEFEGNFCSKFCSNNCKSANRRSKGFDNIPKICPVCGKEFQTNKYQQAKTCSKKCGWKMRKNRASR